MKRLIDIECPACTHREYDIWLEAGEYPKCLNCGETTQRLWSSTASAHGDDIPGGLWLEHGLCNADGSPKRWDSKKAIAKAAKAKGLHWGAFLHGSPAGRTWF